MSSILKKFSILFKSVHRAVHQNLLYYLKLTLLIIWITAKQISMMLQFLVKKNRKKRTLYKKI